MTPPDDVLARVRDDYETARMGMDAYAAAVEEFAAQQGHNGAWGEADAVRRLLARVPALVAVAEAAREWDEADVMYRAGEGSGARALVAEMNLRSAVAALAGGAGEG